MQFSKLRLLGFKSFVDPTELVIRPGLTGVVGPNGCGKSNLLEALRWVMGENRASAMRGGGMDDVIFAGADSRPARNFAEVTLTLDNRERLAPAAFNTEDSLEIVRRITRDAGSAYKVNGKDCRARDVQMLFADASTGAHSPALVRQGQIAELINAKPKARRRVLEEAAGISGLYKRRHEAELKLNGTESNLVRVEDVLEQLDSQLRTLERQAKQAARYRQIADELRRSEGLLLYRRWREADVERLAAEGALGAASKAAAGAQGKALAAVKAREAAEGKVPPLREEEAIAGAVLQRLQVEQAALAEQEARARQAISDLEARIAQLEKDAEREAGLNKDAGETVERLDWEAEALAKAGAGQEDKLAEAKDAASEAAQNLQHVEAEADQLSEDAARLSARHQSATRRLEDAKGLVAKLAGEIETARDAQVDVVEAYGLAKGQVAEAEALQVASMAEAEAAEAVLLAAEERRAVTQRAEGDMRVALSEAEGEAKAHEGELAALQRLISRDQSEGAQILDKVRADKGYEAALGAALADDLKAPEVGAEAASGWVEYEALAKVAALPAGAASLALHVAAPAALNRRLQMVGVVARAEGALLQGQLLPGQRLVSVEGDLWRWDGFRAGAEDAPSEAALRLQRQNRLAELEAAAKVAQENAAKARAAHASAKALLEAAQAEDQAARAARRRADEEATNAVRRVSKAQAEAESLAARVESLALAVKRREEDAAAAGLSLKEAETGVAELGDLEAAREALERHKLSVEAARLTMMTKRSIADDLRREGEARVRRLREIEKEKGNWARRLENAERQLGELAERIDAGQQELKQAKAAPEEIVTRRADMATALDKAEARRKTAADHLAVGEAALRDSEAGERQAERDASDSREMRARADALSEAAAERVSSAAARVMEETGVAPQVLLETLEADPDQMPDSDVIEADVTRLKRQRDALGAVNLRAEEDAKEVREELETLGAEKVDLEAAVAKLRHGIANLNSEGRERLLAAFETVNKNFEMLFKHLFGGGAAELVLVESDDPLEAGLEIMCQPPGKKLSTLSLLSGGEQTLTAMSLIFAVFLANPSPICVLDEVDAPLDDANVTRFCDLLDEMTAQTNTRFLIITHHAVTMSRMERLFGVTMGEMGVSQLVSVDLRQAEEIVEG
ncbi:MAG: chromosome segregation protein SMC [Rhodobacteraceae bacterium]|nr:chromosome segregation protein SMC [Paracoccaceae bacterium]